MVVRTAGWPQGKQGASGRVVEWHAAPGQPLQSALGLVSVLPVVLFIS